MKPTVPSSKIPTIRDNFYLGGPDKAAAETNEKAGDRLDYVKETSHPTTPSVIYIKIWNESQLDSFSYQTSEKEASSSILTSQYTFSNTETPTSSLLIHSSLKPLFPVPMSTSPLIIELKLPPGA